MSATIVTPPPQQQQPLPQQQLPSQNTSQLQLQQPPLSRPSSSQSPSSVTNTPSVPDYEDPYLRYKPQAKLVKENGGVRFIDGFLWSHVYDEVS